MTVQTRPDSLGSAWPWLLALAIGVGAYLRLDQFTDQVLIDDEWHAVHKVLEISPWAMLRDFGHADYSIPLGLLFWAESRLLGLSEMLMRWPMMACGLVTLALFPWFVARRLGPTTGVVFGFLLAASPLLYLYSRMARPYAITLLLVWVALAAFHHFAARARGAGWAAGAFAVLVTLAVWLHPIVAPFAVAPFLWAGLCLARAAPAERAARLARLLLLGLAVAAMIAAVLLPPALANPHSLAAKAGLNRPQLDTLIGVWFAWLGTPSPVAVTACLLLAALGARDVWRALPVVQSATVALVLTVVAMFVAQPAWSFHPITFGRYLLPFVPLLLCMIAAGSARLASGLRASGGRWRALAAAPVALSPAILLAAQSPWGGLLREPNGQTQHSVMYMDFRPGRSPVAAYMAAIPSSAFWSSLSAEPAGSLRIAAAPFFFESYDWNAPRWEQESRQYVVPAFLTGFCVDRRFGEVPRAPAFRFRNAVHIGDIHALSAAGVRFIVWQKPYTRVWDGRTARIGADTAHCEPLLRERFGPPAYEDEALVAFRVPQVAHAQR